MCESPLLQLPTEIRHSIYRHALKLDGSIEIQHPLWVRHRDYAQPLFRVCRSVRTDALQAFYETNDFIWAITPSDEPTTSLTPTELALSWTLSEVSQYLRFIQLKINLSFDVGGRKVERLKHLLQEFISLTNYGRKIARLAVSIVLHGSHYYSGLPFPERTALLLLQSMKVKGRVEFRILGASRTCATEINELDLPRKMKD